MCDDWISPAMIHLTGNLAEDRVVFDPGLDENRRVPWPGDLKFAATELPSFFLQLLSHNHPPSTKELSYVERFQTEAKVKEEEIQGRIRILEDELERLKKQREFFQMQSFASDVIRSPFRRLPSDIIHQIVHNCPLYNPGDGDTATIAHAPLKLSHVSRIWRHSVHDVSSLWKDIRFVWTELVSPLVDSQHMVQLQHFARLSGTLPLSIKLDETELHFPQHNVWHDQGNGLIPFLRWMLSTWDGCQRLRALEICSQRQEHVLRQFTSAAPTSPHLKIKKCTLWTHPRNTRAGLILNRVYGMPQTIYDINNFLETLPNLRHLWLGRHPDGDFPLEELHRLSPDLNDVLEQCHLWRKLTTLCIEAAFDAQGLYLINLLQLCPNLQGAYFAIEGYCLEPDIPASAITVIHPNLRELCIHLDQYHLNILTAFMDCRFPKLTSLQLHFTTDSSPSEGCSLLLAARIFPSLRKLAISGDWGDYSMGIYSLLMAFPTITDLTITFFPMESILPMLNFLWDPESIPATLDDAAEVSTPLPHLCNLHLQFPNEAQYENGVIYTELPEELTASSFAIMKQARPSLYVSIYCLVQQLHSTDDNGLEGRYKGEVRQFFEAAQQTFAEDGIDIDVRIVSTDWIYPASPLRAYFATYFDEIPVCD